MVIPVRDGRTTLPVCLEAVRAQSVPPRAVYVVDNGSTDGTYEWLQGYARKEPLVRALREPRPGAAAARNTGVRETAREGGYEVVAFTDADCVPEEGWLEALTRAFDRERIGAVTGRIRPSVPDTLVGRYLALSAFDPGAQDRVARTPWLTEGIAGGNSAVRVTAFQDVGLFDESFLVAQDWELGLRLVKAGWWLRYTPTAVVRHRQPERAVWDLVHLAAKYARGRPAVLLRHFPGYVFLSAFRRTVRARSAITADVRLTSPEKVVLGLCVAALRCPWAWWLVPGYGAYLAGRLWRAARRQGDLRLRAWELPAMVGLQLVESAASNGRALVESLRRGALCV